MIYLKGLKERRMSCVFHPSRESVGACVKCGRLLCEECKEVRNGRIYCGSCALGVAEETAAEAAGPSNLNWFERHLNWTMILAMAPAGMIVLIGAATGSEDVAIAIGLMAVLGVFIFWGWALRKKGRSLWWLLLFLFLNIFGLLLLFYVESRSQTSEGPPRSRIAD